ncbi:hypothetical protein SeLEV6574_g08348, partial [Synchytrium endobioticum]
MVLFTLTQSTPGHSHEEEIDNYIRSIQKFRCDVQNDMNTIATDNNRPQYRGNTRRYCLESDLKVRLSSLQKLRWSERWIYDELIELPKTQIRWVPVCIAHEELIIDRAKYDMKRLQEYCKFYCGIPEINKKAEQRLNSYQEFIDHHEQNIAKYRVLDIDGVSNPLVASTDQVDRRTLDLLGRGGIYGTSDPMETSTNY